MHGGLAVIVAAAGSSRRMKDVINKQYMHIAELPVLNYCLDIFEEADLVKEIIVVVQANEIDYCKETIIRKRGYKKIARIIPGGARRQDSVRAGLAQLENHTGLIAIHDGARPFVSITLINKLAEEANLWGAAIPGRPAVETLKRVNQDLSVKETIDRAEVWTIQTPQVFRTRELIAAYIRAESEGYSATDDASLYEKYIGKVIVVPGEEDNIKITTPEDLERAEFIISRRMSGSSRQ